MAQEAETGLDMDVDKVPDNPKNKEVRSPELERGVVNAALDLYDVIQLDFFLSETSAISGTRKKQKVMLKCGIHKLSDVLFVIYVFQEGVAAKAAGIEFSHYMLGGDNICSAQKRELPENHGFNTIKSFSEICERVFHKEEACKQLVKRFIKVKLLPNGDYIQKEAALWVAFKPK
ncbi:hypothetical protein L1887_24162 [Cichorium endivia]|nr:hypothetical protein L1887_24162 [Cichorium endivia]